MKPLLLLLLIPFTSTPPIPYRQLTWEDFKGKPPANTEAYACTCTNIAIGYDTAYAIFIPERSWTKTNDAAVLRHEQLHFAITKSWAYNIYFCIKYNHQDAIPDNLRLWSSMQRQYDFETNHGTDSVAQKHWEELIKL